METEAILSSSEWISAGGILLVLVGISFLVLEFFLPSFGLFGFAGVASILIGIVQLHQSGHIEKMPISVDALIVIAIIGIFLSIAGGWYSWKLYRKRMTTGTESMIGETARVTSWKDKTGHIMIQGESWQAYSDNTLSLKKNDEVIISMINGLKIKVIKSEE